MVRMIRMIHDTIQLMMGCKGSNRPGCPSPQFATGLSLPWRQLCQSLPISLNLKGPCEEGVRWRGRETISPSSVLLSGVVKSHKEQAEHPFFDQLSYCPNGSSTSILPGLHFNLLVQIQPIITWFRISAGSLGSLCL